MVFSIEKRQKPILKWAGGKSGLIGQFQAFFPKSCRRYIEPFLGGGAVFLSLKEGIPCVINDSNPELFNLYQIIRDEPEELMQALDRLASQYSEDFYYELRSTKPRKPVKRAARTLFLNKTGFNGLYRQNLKGEFNVPFGKRLKCPELYDPVSLRAVSNRIQKAHLLNLDFEAIVELACPGDFIYCDPPYEPRSRTSSFNAYQRGGFSQAEQLRLRDACLRAVQRGASICISNADTLFTRQIYSDFDLCAITAKRAINSKASARGAISELLARKGLATENKHSRPSQ